MFSQSNYYVALEINGGNDSLNNGSINSPFRTVNKALTLMNSGDTCFIRSGNYHQEVLIDGKNDIVITSFNDEFVCFEGTSQITSNWVPYDSNVYKTTLNRHIWQLFVDNNQMVMARWPNANFKDTSIYSLDTWASGIVDSTIGYPNGSYNGFELVDTTKFNLGSTGIDITGAIGIMNVGSFKTFNREITSHNVNENFFYYNSVPNNAYRDKHHNFFLEGKLELLDQANEWFYDTTSKTLYLYPEDGQNPNGKIIKGKIQDYAININNSSNITINNLSFFATTFIAKSSSGIIISSCNFSYPNCSKRMIKDFLTAPKVSSLGESGNVNKVNNSVIEKCLFEFTDGEALRVYGDNNRIENCYMRFIDYSVSELPFLMVGVYINGDSNKFLHNTVHHSSASAFIAPGTSPEFAYNEVFATGSLQSDGSVYQGTAATVQNSNIHHNYIHDTPKYALRFDAPGGSPGLAGQYGKMHHNIVVRTNGIMVKGNHHYICHNTTFSSRKNGLIILDEDNSNDSSYIFNNFSEKMSAHRSNQSSIPGISSNNWNGYDNPNTNFYTLIDTINYLPLINSSLIDSGIIIPNIPHQIYNTFPDIGALEFGVMPWATGVDWSPTHYPWIQGCSDSNACNYDSTVNINDPNLCIYPDSSFSIVTSCDNFFWDGVTYTQSGIYTNTYTNLNGCDSLHTLNLTINNSDTNSTIVVQCDSYTWPVNGVTYTSSINDTIIGTNSSGCVEVNILDLTINYSNILTLIDTACDSYTWPVNGVTYSSSTIDTVLGINSLGCVETNILDLTINYSNILTLIDTSCDNYTWPVNGVTYSSSTIDTVITVNAFGCFDTSILNLTVNSSTSSIINISACDSYYWNGQIYNSSGSYNNTSINSNGCDSNSTLNLTINVSYNIYNNESICFGESINVGNNNYDQNGTYTDTLSSDFGCDSIIVTQLNIYTEFVSTLSQNANDIQTNIVGGTGPFTYHWSSGQDSEIITPIINGVYWVIVTDANGCVSDTSFINVEWISTTTEDLNLNNIIVYPNPTKDIFHIEFSSLQRQDFELRIINLIGEVIYLENINNFIGQYHNSVSLSTHSKSIYFLEIQTSKGIINKKIILQ